MPIHFLYCLISILSVSSLISCSKNKDKNNDWQRMNLKSYVKQIDESRYNSFQELKQDVNAKRSFTRFKPSGLISSSAIYRANNNMLWMKYSYMGDSVWINETIEVDNKIEQPQAYWLYQLNEQGAQISITSILIDSSINFNIKLDVNQDGNATSIYYNQQKHPENVPCSIRKIYTEKGHIKEELVYRYDPIRKKCAENPTTSIFSTNEQGDIIRESMLTYDGRKRLHSYRYQYDNKGNWIQRTHYLDNNILDLVTREFTYYSDSLILNQ